jgi:hypothetical protein
MNAEREKQTGEIAQPGFDWAAFFRGPQGKLTIAIVCVLFAVVVVLVIQHTSRSARAAEAWEDFARAENSVDQLQALADTYVEVPAGGYIRYRVGMLLYRRAMSGAGAGGLEEAAAAFQAVAARRDVPFLAPLALVQLGCVREAQAAPALRAGKADAARARLAEARRVYTEAVDRYPGTFGAELAKDRIGSVKAVAKRLAADEK